MQEYNIVNSPDLKLNQSLEEISIPAAAQSIQIFMDVFSPKIPNLSREHWHHSFQFNIVLEGTLEIFVNGERHLLQKGDGIFINANTMHSLTKDRNLSSVGYSFQVPASAICSDKEIHLYDKYIAPVVSNPAFTHALFTPDVPWHAEILEAFDYAFKAANKKEFAYELEVKMMIYKIWILLLKNASIDAPKYVSATVTAAIDRMKEMLAFIRQNYSQRLTLQEIADNGNISIAVCNRYFRKFVGQTPIEYLMHFRIISSCKMMSKGKVNLSECAYECGFSDYSYFYRTFKKQMGMTPKEYLEQLENPVK